MEQSPDPLPTASQRQAEHYARIHDSYTAHYYDPQSVAYRERFIFDRWFHDLDLNDKVVVDLACGNGANSAAILRRYPRARPVGLDLSAQACEDYRRLVGAPAYQCDLTASAALPVKANVAIVFGGLHHCVSNLSGTFATVAALLEPGGLLLMYEPNARFVLEGIRKHWYRHDRYFDAPTEHALDPDELLRLAGSQFRALDCTFAGGPAYFLILNSLVLRVPLMMKRPLARPLFWLEQLYERLPGAWPYPTFIARWQFLGKPVARVISSPTAEH